MSRRAAYTLLFIKSDLIARADFGAAPKLSPLGLWERPQGANVRLYHSIETAIKLGGKCGRNVWVIGEAFWTQTLSLPATALHGLTRDQIAKAIGFDVEALTGVSGADSALGFSQAAPTTQSEHLWVTQVPLASRAQIQSVVRSAGGKLAGILHPGGLPQPLAPAVDPADSAATWRRIEVWKDTTFGLIGRRADGHRLTIINGDPAQDAWRANVTRWLNDNGADHTEWLGPRGSLAAEPVREDEKPWEMLPVLTGDALRDWLARWASKLLIPGSAGVPIIERGRANTLRQRQYAAVAAIILACAAGCVWQAAWLGNQRTTFTERQTALTHQLAAKTSALQRIEAPKHEWDQLQQQIKPLRSTLKTLQSERLLAAQHGVPDIAVQRRRVLELLAALARNARPDLAIDRISPQGNGDLLVEGKCLPNSSVDSFANALAEALPKVGWEVSPAQKQPSGLIPAGAFTLAVTHTVEQKVPDVPDEIIPSSSLIGSAK